MPVRALRGAITCGLDSPDEIHSRTVELLTTIFARNDLDRDQLVSLFFTATTDLTALAPAAAARAFGLTDVPLLCAQEMAVPGSLPLCVRIMLHFETDTPRSELRHVFLGGAVSLRPELAEPGDADR